MKLLIVVPAFNLAEAIAPVVREIRQTVPAATVLVIDDGSSDKTAGRAKVDNQVQVVRHEENRGKGAALRTGFDWAVQEGFDAVVTLDGDGQHPPSAIPDLVSRQEETGADLIVGARTRRHTKMPLHRRLSNKITSSMASRMAGCALPDSQSGYRLIRTALLEKVELTTSHYETETELLIKAARAGFAIDSAAIPTVYADETSHINVVRDTIRFLQLMRRLGKEV